MKPKKTMERLPLRMPANTVEALERLRVSYSGVIGPAPMLEADQAVQKVVEMTLRNARSSQRTA